MKQWLPSLVLCLSACVTSNTIVSLGPPSPPPTAKEYVDVLKRWTRHGDLRSDFDATIIVDATFHSPEFHSAYVAKYLDVYKITPDNRERIAADLPLAEDDFELHVETETHTYEVNELRPKKSIWRISLIDDRGRSVLVKDVKSENTRPEFLQVFYPYTRLFARTWKLVFPKALADGTPLVTPETKSLTLRIAGPAGSVDLLWRLR